MNIFIRFISLVTLFLLFILIISDNSTYLFLIIIFLFIISLIEYIKMKYKNREKKSIFIFILLIIILILICRYKYYLSFFSIIVFLIFIFQFYLILNFKKIKIQLLKKNFIIMLLYILFTCISICNIWFWHNSKLTYNFFLIAILMASLNDMFAYIGGILFGKNKIKFIINISPNKTSEGFIFGCLFFIFFLLTIKFLALFKNIHLFGQISFLDLFYLLAFSMFIIPLGDLIISLVKRIYIVKDTGQILPGHGGILDRIDSTIPVWVFISIYIKLSYDYIYVLNI